MKEFFLRLRAYSIVKRHGIQDSYFSFLMNIIESEIAEYNLVNSVANSKNTAIMDDRIAEEITVELTKNIILKISDTRRVLVEEYFIGRGNLMTFVANKVYLNSLKLSLINNSKIL
jgi:hypothetical protein